MTPLSNKPTFCFFISKLINEDENAEKELLSQRRHGDEQPVSMSSLLILSLFHLSRPYVLFAMLSYFTFQIF